MHRPYEHEVKDLLSRMTVEEKLGQLQQLTWTGDTGPGGGQTEEVERAARAGLLGSVLNLFGAEHTNTLQRMAVEESRLGIPLLFGQDVIHGFWTTFPIPLAEASSFDPAVVELDAEISAMETRSNGIRWTFSPMMDVTHEPRWGRIAESCGEDPYLNTVLAVAKIRGYQGDDLSAGHNVAACAKHFVAYGGAEGGRDYNTVDVSEQRLRNLYLPPFKASVDAGVATVMAAFNTVSGVPAHGNPHTMTGILKEEWGFDGVVVSDYTGVEELIAHGYAADAADAARLALMAGLDMEMVSTTIAAHGKRLLAEGRVTEDRLDDAVARILRLKFELGLFENPRGPDARRKSVVIGCAEHREVALRAARESIVLLKNDGLLPLDPSTLTRLAVVGPNADDDLAQLGDWSLGSTQYPKWLERAQILDEEAIALDEGALRLRILDGKRLKNGASEQFVLEAVEGGFATAQTFGAAQESEGGAVDVLFDPVFGGHTYRLRIEGVEVPYVLVDQIQLEEFGIDVQASDGSPVPFPDEFYPVA